MKNKNYKSLFMLSSVGLTAVLGSCGGGSKQANEGQAADPNILLIVVDDMGYSDCGAFGGEIKTPHIDSLAQDGIRFSSFHTSSLSAPTRSMLLTGIDTHLNGLGVMPNLHTTNQYMQEGYEGYLNKHVMTLPEVLQENGYHTYMAGKWHLGYQEGTRPSERGFDRSFALLNGGASHFSDAAGMGTAEPPVQYVEDGQPVAQLPDSFFSSDYYASKMIGYIDSQTEDAPFFGYLAFTAPHDPLQVPDEWLDKYKGVYDAGYNAIRKQRVDKINEMGLMPYKIEESLPSGEYTAWEKLSEDAKKIEAKKMEIYAAMIENVDYNIGRVLQKLKEKGMLENTIVLFMSDNGANKSDLTAYGKLEDYNVDNSYENMGKVGSFISEGIAWASVSNTPLALFKLSTAEGGINTPLIVSGKGVDKGKIDNKNLLHVCDIMPTLLDITAIERPDVYKGNSLHPMYGKSFTGLLDTKNAEKSFRQDNEAVCIEMMDHIAVFKGKWKARKLLDPFGDGQWQLFDLSKDITESKDLSSENADKLDELIQEWNTYSESVGYIKRNGRRAVDSLGSVERFYQFK